VTIIQYNDDLIAKRSHDFYLSSKVGAIDD